MTLASPTVWDQDPLGQFTAFVRTPAFADTSNRRPPDVDLPPIADDSAEVYTFMFGKFTQWLTAEQLVFSRLTYADVLRFLQKKGSDGKPELNSKIAYRYLRLLDRCYSHLGADHNPARYIIANTKRSDYASDEPMVALSAEARDAFLAALPPAKPLQWRAGKPTAAWKSERNRAMVAVLACSGLRVAEVIGLLLPEVGNQPRLDGSLALTITPDEKHATSYEHETVLREPGVEILLSWLRTRRALAIPGERVFPTNLQGEPLDKATVYRHVRATFEAADLNVLRAGGRTLRNTFAVQELDRGASTAELKGLLGLALERSAEVYAMKLKEI